MGISYQDMLSLTWKEFDYYHTGHARKIERGWDYTRHLIATMANINRSKNSKVFNAKEVMPLSYLDRHSKREFRRVKPDTKRKYLKFIDENYG